ncbi:MAG: 2,3,4,5-tetrahydropyridine-2,6-dicarboxylate N-succinyltransferase, partial [Pseudomonadales bacterium]|nr:2,3,4,5-tetrahydropyridine-2,6-dicarboxylate N-succinyltransferase [Pseudomonadales bacterium]
MSSMFAFGLGLGTLNSKGEMLDTFFPAPLAQLAGSSAQQLLAALDAADISCASDGVELTLNDSQLATLA